jgi:hypothetical protein
VNLSVIWLDSVEADILRLYLVARAAGYAEEYTQATARIENLLNAAPMQAGESRAGHQRLLIDFPLTVEFEVYEEQRTVIVTRVRYTPPR